MAARSLVMLQAAAVETAFAFAHSVKQSSSLSCPLVYQAKLTTTRQDGCVRNSLHLPSQLRRFHVVLGLVCHSFRDLSNNSHDAYTPGQPRIHSHAFRGQTPLTAPLSRKHLHLVSSSKEALRVSESGTAFGASHRHFSSSDSNKDPPHGDDARRPPFHIPSAAAPKTEPETAKASELLTLPTILTLVRVAAVPALVSVYFTSPEATTVIFVLASLTDWLDGYLARKMGTISAFGAFLDPVADKLMVAAALVLLCTQPLPLSLPPWALPVPAIAIIGREIAMSAVREWAAAQGGDLHQAVAVSSLGKWKTATQMIALTLLLWARHASLAPPIAEVTTGAGLVLLYSSAALALVSLGQYLRAIWGPIMKASS